MPITFQGAAYPSVDESYYYTTVPPSSGVGYLPIGFGRLDTDVTLGWGTNNVPANLLPFLTTKPFQKISIQHTAGTHPTAFLEIAAYNMGAEGKPTTLIEKGTVSLSATGIKTVTFSTPKTINGMFLVGVRPNIGATDWSVSGTGTLTLRGVSVAGNTVANQIFGSINPSTFSTFHGTLLYRYSSFNLFPNDLTNDAGVALFQAANGSSWISVIHN
jgi:hypothetical protein